MHRRHRVLHAGCWKRCQGKMLATACCWCCALHQNWEEKSFPSSVPSTDGAHQHPSWQRRALGRATSIIRSSQRVDSKLRGKKLRADASPTQPKSIPRSRHSSDICEHLRVQGRS